MNFRNILTHGALTALLLALVAQPLAQAATAPVSLTDAAITHRYLARRDAVINRAIDAIKADDPTKGNLVSVAACLQSGRNVEAALARLKVYNEPKPTGDMFWAYPMASVMVAGRKNLDDASWARIQELWKTYWPNRGDTENHWAMSYATRYLAAQMRPDAGPSEWFNGRSSAENMAIAKDYLLHWMWITTSYGQGEYDSPNYIEEYIIPMALLAGWAEDSVLRQKAKMMLDYIIYDYAIEQVDGTYGGAHSRIYPKQLTVPGNAYSSKLGWFLFGMGNEMPAGSPSGNVILAMSGYVPPPILERIARDKAKPYVEKELKRTRWRMRHAGPHSFTIDDKRTVPVYKYSYVDHDFVLGSSQGGLLQPIQQQTWSLVWRTKLDPAVAANTFFGVQPYYSALEGTMYFGGDWDTMTDLIARSKVTYNSPDKLASGSPNEQVFQHNAALIALYDVPEGSTFSHITTFFSRDLQHTDQDASGWIFTQGGPVYIAFRPFAPGVWKPYDWTNLLKGGAGAWIASGFDKWGEGHKCLVSSALRNGYIVQVAPVRDYPSFAAFKTAVLALPLKFSVKGKPEATFTSLDGSVLHARYGDTPTVNGQLVDYAHWPLFDSPFAHEKRGSQRLLLHQGGERYLLDFTKPAIKESVDSTQR